MIRELNILLGDNDAAAHAYVDRVRAKMMERYEEVFEQGIAKAKAFGENSYFRRKKLELPLRSDDDSEDAEEQKLG